VAFLIGGEILSLGFGYFFALTGAFGGADSGAIKNFFFMAWTLTGIFLPILFLLMFRWCTVGSIAIWCLTLCSFVFGLLAGVHGASIFLFLIVGVIATGIRSES